MSDELEKLKSYRASMQRDYDYMCGINDPEVRRSAERIKGSIDRLDKAIAEKSETQSSADAMIPGSGGDAVSSDILSKLPEWISRMKADIGDDNKLLAELENMLVTAESDARGVQSNADSVNFDNVDLGPSNIKSQIKALEWAVKNNTGSRKADFERQLAELRKKV